MLPQVLLPRFTSGNSAACCVLGLVYLVVGSMALHYKKLSEEERLMNRLFKDYNPSARPVLNSSRTVNVDIDFSLLQIQQLNVRSQVLTTTGLLILRWEDERLKWTEEECSLEEVVVDGRNMWKPEFAVINGAEAIYEDYSEFQAVVHRSGRVRWEPGGVFKTMCTIDITYYPFDEQHCELTFGAWSYYTSKMNLTTKATKINTDNYDVNGEWLILKTTVKRNEFNFECCPDQRFSNVAFSVFLRRRHTFYIMNVILPGILTSAVLLSIFFCTPAQKVHIGVAALLSFRLFLLNVADTIPRTSDHVPLLGIYLTCTMAITTMAMVATVFVLNLYGMKEKPVPMWAKKVFIIYMARLLCMCTCGPEYTYHVDDTESRSGRRNSNQLRLNKHKYKYSQSLSPEHAHRDDDATVPLQSRSQDSHGRVSPRGSVVSARGSVSSASSPHLNFKSPFQFTPLTEKKSKDKPDYSKDWIHVAAVFDRLFFWLCLIFILVTTLLLFHPLTTYRYFKMPSEHEEKT